MPRITSDVPASPDEEVQLIVGAISRQMHRDTQEFVNRSARAFEACIRFAPVAIFCRLVRVQRGLDFATLARALKVPQHELSRLEDGDVFHLDYGILRRFVDGMGLKEWFESWADANPRVMALFTQPPVIRASLRLDEMDALVTGYEEAMRSEEERQPPPSPPIGIVPRRKNGKPDRRLN